MWKREPLTDDELAVLLDAAEQRGLKFDFTCRALTYTGLRADEFAHMTEDWIDWQEEIVRVPAEQDGWTPKTDHSARTIPVREPSAIRVMREWFKRNSAVGVSRQSVTNRVKSVASGTDLKKKVTPHVLRHTYGTLIARKGASPQYIRQTMGHADLSSANAYLEYTGAQLGEEANDLW